MDKAKYKIVIHGPVSIEAEFELFCDVADFCRKWAVLQRDMNPPIEVINQPYGAVGSKLVGQLR